MNLVTGRAGELVDYANETTFEIVKAIFGYGGPYRKVLHTFGIGDLKNRKEFLQLIEGRVYTDIDTETEILWKPCSYRLKSIDTKVVTEFHFYGLIPLLGFFKKTVTEVIRVAFIDHYIKKVDKIYRDFSLEVEKILEKKSLTLERFLVIYESVVLISYLYELVFNYNNSKGFVNKSEELKKYLLDNDFMLSSDQNYAEFVYRLPQDFVFGIADGSLKKELPSLKFIPSSIPNYEGEENNEISAEAKLQCIKNNMRLKTNVLLYFLNQTLYMEA